MNIFQLIHSIESISSGPSYSVAMLSQTLSHKNNVELISFGRATGVDITGVRLNYISDKASIIPLLSIKYRNALSRIYADPNSILHGHAIWRAINLAPLFRQNTARAKIMWSPRGAFSDWSMNHHKYRKLPFWTTLQKPAMKKVDCFHATAESEYISIRQLGFKQPVALIPNGVDIYPEKSITRDKSILFLGRIHNQKGIELLLDAWKAICQNNKNWTLKIAGPINSLYSRQLYNKALQENIPRLSFLGEVTGQDKIKLLNQSSVLALPTYTENFGMVVAEALACSLPVVTTTGTPWLNLERDKMGWVIQPRLDELINCLSKIIQTPEHVLCEMGENGRRRMSEKYSWDIVGDSMESSYKWLLGLGEKPNCVIEE